MKIGELAKAAKCSVETIRYYEKQGLLPKPERSGKNYRFYEANLLQRLVFIRNCRMLDMSQREIAALLNLMDNFAGDCDSVNALLEEHISHVDLRITELKRLKGKLVGLRQKCRGKTKVNDCGILRGISQIGPEETPLRTTHLK